MGKRLIAALILTGCALPPAVGTPPKTSEAAAVCVPPGRWVDGGGDPTDEAAILDRASRATASLLGESHDDARHHRWQLDTIAAIHRRDPNIAIGMEMFPRRVQPVLDAWVAGSLDETAFLRRSEWAAVWGFPPDLYLPILRFARDNRIPLVALNVERSLVRRTGREGWAAIPVSEREGVGDPAPVTDAYRARLKAVMSAHGGGADGKPGADSERKRAALERFIQAQSVWDRAMAEAIAETRSRTGRRVVAIMGAGHARHRDGVPHQLGALGIADVMVLLPWDAEDDCAELAAGTLGDGLYGIPATP